MKSTITIVNVWGIKMMIFNIVLVLLADVQVAVAQQEKGAWGEKDWLFHAALYNATIEEDRANGELILSNGLVSRSFLLQPNLATIGIKNLVTGEQLLRGVKPEGEIVINDKLFAIGGLSGQKNYAFLTPENILQLETDTNSFLFTGYSIQEPEIPFTWKRVRHSDTNASWPPKGIHLILNFEHPQLKEQIRVQVHYELYDGIPVWCKWLTLNNGTKEEIMVNDFTSEIIAAVEYGSAVESRKYNVDPPNIHVETDYAFASFNVEDANHQVVHWLPDPQYDSQVNYLKQTPCLLKVSPEIGPGERLESGQTFTTFRTFVMPYDSYDRERQGLALRKMYRTLAPWVTENPLMMHARFADWEQVKKAIDQCAEAGFEMVILTFGSGFNIEDNSPEYLEKMAGYAQYAAAKGIEIGGYSLLASRSIDAENDVVMPDGMTPTFGHSPCLGSAWSSQYFKKLYQFFPNTGFSLLEHDGSYPGDICTSEKHPGHEGLEDSQWEQYRVISDFYRWCRGNGIYLNVPDYYYLSGSNKCGMGYREVNWSLPRAQQVLHTRQNIYDGTWTKTPSMGWMFVPLTEYHGGGAEATIEPLEAHLNHYKLMMASNLGAGVQACYRGPRLFDTDSTKTMVKEMVNWFKQHREVLEGDVIHLRRADGRDIDYWLNVHPEGNEKGLLMVFNPLNERVTRSIEVPLYYTGLRNQVEIIQEQELIGTVALKPPYSVEVTVDIPANGYTWVVFK